MDIRGVGEMKVSVCIIKRSTDEKFCLNHAIKRILTKDENFDLELVNDEYFDIRSICPDCIEEQM